MILRTNPDNSQVLAVGSYWYDSTIGEIKYETGLCRWNGRNLSQNAFMTCVNTVEWMALGRSFAR